MLFGLSEARAQSAASRTAEGQTQIKPLKIGDTIPEALWQMPLQVVNHPDGREMITLNDYRDKKLIILDFWATSCPPCVQSLAKYIAYLETDLHEHMALVPVLVYDKMENARPFLEKRGWAIPSVINGTLLNHAILSDYLEGYGVAWIVSGKLHAVPKAKYVNEHLLWSVINDSNPSITNWPSIR